MILVTSLVSLHLGFKETVRIPFGGQSLFVLECSTRLDYKKGIRKIASSRALQSVVILLAEIEAKCP
jgi:hypothetical protein